MALAISAAVFFVLWGILNDSGVEAPWVTSGVAGSSVLFLAVIVREIVLRRARTRYIRQQRRLQMAPPRVSGSRDQRGKLTLERNAAILDEIRRKSEAALVLNKLSAGHREVFELCSEYISQNEGELKSVSAGSPRLAPLLKGRSSASELHRYHMLRWAEIEVTNLTNEARSLATPEERLSAAAEALDVLNRSLASYPSETSLLQSRDLIQELAVSIKVSGWIEQAERAEFKGEYAEARSLYRDALFELGRDNVYSASREAAADKIRAEIDRLGDIDLAEGGLRSPDDN